jgi:hypothetical protein
MADARVELKVGGVSFCGEGTEAWVSAELDKAIRRISELAKIAPSLAAEAPEGPAASPTQKVGTLAAFLKAKNATTNQNRKFLSTAIWLHERDKKDRLTTTEVTKALSDSQQSRLGNPSDCLNQNVSKGFCEKDERGFYVTEEGRAEIA